MTVKDELMIFWVCCLVLVSLVVRHLLGCAADLLQQVAALSLSVAPHLLQFFASHLFWRN